MCIKVMENASILRIVVLRHETNYNHYGVSPVWSSRGIPSSGDYIISYSHPRYSSLSRHVHLNFSRHRRPRITLDNAKLRKLPRTGELEGGNVRHTG